MLGIRYAPLLALLLVPAGLAAQAAWDTPSFMRPGAPAGVTFALTDSDPGDGLGALAIWRRSGAPTGVGFRAGIAEGPGDDLVALVGIDISGSLSGSMGPGAPEAIWWTGVGVGLGNDVSASFPLGIVFGWTAVDEGVSLMPYAGGHVVLDVISEGPDELDLDAAVDVGLDIGVSGGWIFRFGAAFGGRESLGIGVRIPR